MPKRDAGAGPQTGQDQIVGCGAGVVPSESLRFICDERVALSPDLTRITRAGLDDDAMGVVVPFVGVDGFQLDVLACPGGKDRPDVLRIRRAGHQVVRVVQRNEALGVLGQLVQARGMLY